MLNPFRYYRARKMRWAVRFLRDGGVLHKQRQCLADACMEITPTTEVSLTRIMGEAIARRQDWGFAMFDLGLMLIENPFARPYGAVVMGWDEDA